MRHVLTVTPTIDTTAFTAGDQVGGIQTLTGFCDAREGAKLEKVTILDKAGQSAEVTIFFFDSLPTVASANNEALSIADAQMEKCIGHVTVIAGDYKATAANSIACKVVDQGLFLKPATTGVAGTIYAVVKTAGTPTYGSTADLIIKYQILS